MSRDESTSSLRIAESLPEIVDIFKYTPQTFEVNVIAESDFINGEVVLACVDAMTNISHILSKIEDVTIFGGVDRVIKFDELATKNLTTGSEYVLMVFHSITTTAPVNTFNLLSGINPSVQTSSRATIRESIFILMSFYFQLSQIILRLFHSGIRILFLLKFRRQWTCL